jgi:hypothetical protein
LDTHSTCTLVPEFRFCVKEFSSCESAQTDLLKEEYERDMIQILFSIFK